MIKKNILLSSIIVMIVSTVTWGKESPRDCIILPIIEYRTENRIGFKVFEGVENFIKKGDWCNLKSNSALLDLLSNYQKNLGSVLEKKEVLKTIASKLHVGSLIKIYIGSKESEKLIKIVITNDSGEEVLFKDQLEVKDLAEDEIIPVITTWLSNYDKSLPMVGRIKNILGDLFTIETFENNPLYSDRDFKIMRYLGVKKHPMLNDFVGFDLEEIGRGVIVSQHGLIVQGKATSLVQKKSLQAEDWIVLLEQKKINLSEIKIEKNENIVEVEEPGRLGLISMHLTESSAAMEQSGNEMKRYTAPLVGVDVSGELWINRNYWMGIDLHKNIGTYSKDVGNVSSDSLSTMNSDTRIKMGYRYLPMGFFYGPEISVYTGYGNYNYGISSQSTDYITEVNWSGLLTGIKGSLPITKQVRAQMAMDFLLLNSFKEKATMLGATSGSSSYRFELGASYEYITNYALDFKFEMKASKASFTSAPNNIKELYFKDNIIKLGIAKTF